jgi:hypothetical protein
MTLSPSLKDVTAEPRRTTVPLPSWEAVIGRREEKVPEATMLSVWQWEATAIFIRRSCGPREVGTGMVLIW